MGMLLSRACAAWSDRHPPNQHVYGVLCPVGGFSNVIRTIKQIRNNHASTQYSIRSSTAINTVITFYTDHSGRAVQCMNCLLPVGSNPTRGMYHMSVFAL